MLLRMAIMATLSLSFSKCGGLEVCFLESVSLVLLLLVGNTLQSEEVLSALLVELFFDVVNGELDAGNDDVLEGVDTSVGDLDDLVEGDKLCLKGGDVNEYLEEALKAVATLLDGLATTGQTQHRAVIVVAAGRVSPQREDGQVHTGNVIAGHVQPHIGARTNRVEYGL